MVTVRQASFIEASISTLEGKLIAASVVVAIVLFLFLGNLRTTLISLTAIPVSILVTVLVFRYFGMSINTMTLGGLTIAIGGLVDDAVVGVENVLRRMKQDRLHAKEHHVHFRPAELIARATMEVRSAIVYATVIIVLVLVPLFFLPGMEGRLMLPLAIAYIVSLLASMLVSVTLTPVLAYYLLPGMKQLDHGDHAAAALDQGAVPSRRSTGYWSTRGRCWPQARWRRLARPQACPSSPRRFCRHSTKARRSSGCASIPARRWRRRSTLRVRPKCCCEQVPEVEHVGRRSGRAELDEHAEGVHVSELDVALRRSERTTARSFADMRRVLVHPAGRPQHRPADLPPHRPHALGRACRRSRSRSSATISTRCADRPLRCVTSVARIPGVADLEIEKQVLTPQVKIRIDYERAAHYGVSPSELPAELQMLIDGERITQIIEGNRRFALVLRLPESARIDRRTQTHADRHPWRSHPALTAGNDRGVRRPEPDLARRWPSTHRAVSQRAGPRAFRRRGGHPRVWSPNSRFRRATS